MYVLVKLWDFGRAELSFAVSAGALPRRQAGGSKSRSAALARLDSNSARQASSFSRLGCVILEKYSLKKGYMFASVYAD